MDILAFYDRISGGNAVPATILSMSIMLLAGFLVTRITKKLHLPNVTAYIVAGILIGPFCLNLIPSHFVDATGFLPDIALAFIAFGTGEFFRLETIRKNGIKVFVITIFEVCTASILVFGLCYCIFGLPMPFSLILSALAAATAPTSTIMTIRQTGARGQFVDTLLQVVALDDMVSLIAYSVVISLATASLAGKAVDLYGSFFPFLLNIAVFILGGVFGYLIYLFMRNRHSTDNRLIIAIALMLSFCGIASVLNVSPLLGCMAMGAVYINLSDDDGLFKLLNYFNPPILLLFFVRSGISFDLGSLFASGKFGAYPLIVVSIGYFLVRILGKYLGSMLGCRLAGTSRSVRNYLGLALIPQASVVIGLAELGARTIKGTMGNALMTIILSSGILYELVGPGAANVALYKSGSYVPEDGSTADQITESMDDIQEKEADQIPAKADIQSGKKEAKSPENNKQFGQMDEISPGKGKDKKSPSKKKDKSEEESSKKAQKSKNRNSKNKEKKSKNGDDRFVNLEEKEFEEDALEYFENQSKPDVKTKKSIDKKNSDKKNKESKKHKKESDRDNKGNNQ